MKRTFALAAVATIFLQPVIQYACLIEPSPQISKSLMIFSALITGTLLAGSVFLIPLFLFGAFFKSRVNQCASGLVVCMVILTALLLSNIATGVVTRLCLGRMTVVARPLIAAIKCYEKTNGHPPEKLENLVPKYLPKIPETGLGIHPQFDYTIASESDDWMLEVPCSIGSTIGDTCFYQSTKSYEPYLRSNSVETIGDWVHVHK